MEGHPVRERLPLSLNAWYTIWLVLVLARLFGAAMRAASCEEHQSTMRAKRACPEVGCQ